jgi:hypothetical protein
VPRDALAAYGPKHCSAELPAGDAPAAPLPYLRSKTVTGPSGLVLAPRPEPLSPGLHWQCFPGFRRRRLPESS